MERFQKKALTLIASAAVACALMTSCTSAAVFNQGTSGGGSDQGSASTQASVVDIPVAVDEGAQQQEASADATALGAAALSQEAAESTLEPEALKTIISIGDGTASSRYNGMDAYHKNSATQTLYKSEDIVAAGGKSGLITRISLEQGSAETAKSLAGGTLKIWMAQTDQDALDANGLPGSAFTCVYSATTDASFGATTGWKNFVLTSPYAYDEGKNLVIAVTLEGMPTFSSNVKWCYTTCDAGSSIMRGSDSNAAYADLSSDFAYNTTHSTQRPNIQMVIETADDPVLTLNPTSVEDQRVGGEIAVSASAAKTATGDDIDSSRVTITGYQWSYKMGSGTSVAWGDLKETSATSDSTTFVVPSVVAGSTVSLCCTVNYLLDGRAKSVTSNALTFAVITEQEAAVPTPTVSPLESDVWSSDAKVTLTADSGLTSGDAGVGVLTYQWWSSDASDGEYAMIPGATKRTYSAPAPSTAGSIYYKVSVTNTYESTKVATALSATCATVTLRDHTIGSAAEFQAFADAVNAGESYDGEIFTMTNNVDLAGLSLSPVGDADHPFSGTFDGAGHALMHANVAGDDSCVGLFGNLAGATVKDLVVSDATVSSTWTSDVQADAGHLGGIAGRMDAGTLENVLFEGEIQGTTSDCGGLVGIIETANAAITRCAAQASIDVSGGNLYNESGICSRCSVVLGGLIGTMRYGALADSYADCQLTNRGTWTQDDCTCGLVGCVSSAFAAYATIENSFAYGSITEDTLGDCYGIAKLAANESYYFDEEAPCFFLEGLATAGTNQSYSATNRLTGAYAKKTAAQFDSRDAESVLAMLNAHAKQESDTFYLNEAAGYPRHMWNVTGDPVASLDKTDLGEMLLGSSISLSVDASKTAAGEISAATGLTYQWYAQFEGQQAVAIDGATTAHLDYVIAADAPAGRLLDLYCVVDYELDGQPGQATSVHAQGLVISSTEAAIPTKVSITPDDASVMQTAEAQCLEASCVLDGAGAGVLSYQWYICDADGSNRENIDGATDAVLWVDPTEDLGTRWFGCTVTNTFERVKTASATSSVAAVTTIPLTLSTADDVLEFAARVSTGTDYAGMTVWLGNDIDLDGVAGFEGVGTMSNPFSGTFEGDGHAISGYDLVETEALSAGFFMNIDGAGACVRNVLFKGSVACLTPNGRAGGVVGGAWGDTKGTNPVVLENVGFEGTVSAEDGALCGAGLVGFAQNVAMTGCYAIATIGVNSTATTSYAGGLVGMATGTSVVNSVASGTVANGSAGVNAIAAGLVACGTSASNRLDNSFFSGTCTSANDGQAFGVYYDSTESAAGYYDADKPCYYPDTVAEAQNVELAEQGAEALSSERLTDASFCSVLNEAAGETAFAQVSIGTCPLPVWTVDLDAPQVNLTVEGLPENGQVLAGMQLSLAVDTARSPLGQIYAGTVTGCAWYKTDLTAKADPVCILASGETATYTVTDDDIPGHAYAFCCVVSYENGSTAGTAKSNAVTAYCVTETPAAQPTNVHISCSDPTNKVPQLKTVTLSVTCDLEEAGTGDVSCQWYTCDAQGENLSIMRGEQSPDLSVTGTAVGTNYYVCRVTNVFEGVKVAQATSRVFALETTCRTISTAAELAAFRDEVNAGNGFAGETVMLDADIDISAQCVVVIGWDPIGDSADNAFMGEFDGNGHTISGLSINDDAKYLGLFGFMYGDSQAQRASIHDLEVSGTVASSNTCVGGLLGYMGQFADVSNVGCDVTVTSTYGSTYVEAGGIVGCVFGFDDELFSTISACHNKGAVTAKGTCVGGIVGYVQNGTVSDCYNTGALSVSNDNAVYLGGIVGGGVTSALNVSGCYNAGTISYTGVSTYYGAIMGLSADASWMQNCYYLDTSCKQGNGGATSQLCMAMTAQDMAASAFVSTLNAAAGTQRWMRGASGETPLLSWELPHTDKEELESLAAVVRADTAGVVASDTGAGIEPGVEFVPTEWAQALSDALADADETLADVYAVQDQIDGVRIQLEVIWEAFNDERKGVAEQPVDAIAAAGTTASFSLCAVGDAQAYQWQSSADGVTWVDAVFDGADSDTLAFEMTDVLDGMLWRCAVTYADGAQVISAAATSRLTSTIAVTPASCTAAARETVSLHVEAPENATGFRWQQTTDGVHWSDAAWAGYDTDTLHVTMRASLDGAQWRCIVTLADGSKATSTYATTYLD